MDVNEWLERKFLEWQIDEGRKSLTSFAQYLGIPQAVISHYMSGRYKPSGDNVNKIAAKLGPEIYDLLGLQRPDPLLEEMRQTYDQVSEVRRRKLVSTFSALAKDPRLEEANRILAELPPDKQQEMLALLQKMIKQQQEEETGADDLKPRLAGSET